MENATSEFRRRHLFSPEGEKLETGFGDAGTRKELELFKT